MIQLPIKKLLAACLTVTLCTGPVVAQDANAPSKLANAQSGDIRLFVSGSLLAPVQAIRASVEKETGHKVVIESSESRVLQGEIEAGQPFEAAMLTTAVVKDLLSKGKIVAGSDSMIAVVRVGVAVRGDAPKLDVSTPEGLRKAILGAHSIRRFYGVAASVPILENLFAKLDLDDATKDKMVHLGSGQAAPPEATLPAGTYELIINLISAVVPMKGWIYLGAIPEQFQMPVLHSAGMGSTGNAELGRKVIEALQGPQFDAALKANGISRH